MATEIGKAYIQIVPTTKNVKGNIEKSFQGVGESAGDMVGKNLISKMKSLISGVAFGKVIGKVIAASMKQGAELEQSIGGIETMFKNSASKVRQYAQEAYKTAGVSANEYMKNVTSFSASLLQSLGGDTEKAADIANMAMVDISDNMNKFGSDMGSIQMAYQGFAKQNYTLLDNLKLGYGKQHCRV